MGLESVELVMEVEDHFGIALQNSEIERMRTVGELVQVVHQRLEAARHLPCPTWGAFVALRRCVRMIKRNEKFRIRPSERIVDRLSPAERRELWKELARLLGRSPRDLRRPRWLRRTLFAVFLGGVVMAVYVSQSLNVGTRIFLLFGVSAFPCLLLVATRPFQVVPAKDWETFGDVKQKLVGLVAATKCHSLRTTEEVLFELRPMVVRALGVDASEVVFGARFVEDLGMG